MLLFELVVLLGSILKLLLGLYNLLLLFLSLQCELVPLLGCGVALLLSLG